MKFGFNVFGRPPEAIAGIARKAEEVGFESVWMSDHLIWPKEIKSEYPYVPNPYKGNPPPVGPHTLLGDTLVVLSHVAAVTTKLRLATGVYILPIRSPIVTARAVATLDVVSGGRFSMGVGMGWMPEEFKIAGEGFDDRVERSEECLGVLKTLWEDDTSEFHGKFFDFGPAKFEPKPVQKPCPPILFGGESKAAYHRAVRLGDGFYGLGVYTPDLAAKRVKRLKELRREYGRENEPFEVTLGYGKPTPDEVQQFAEAGVSRLIVSPWTGGDEFDDLERFAENLIGKS